MNEKILTIDDDLDIRSLLSNILNQEGYRVKAASNGREAVDLFKSEPFDLVITDIRMPGMDGLSVMGQLKQMDEDIGVVILTGFATINNAIEALKADGAFDFVTKPLEHLDQFLNTIQQALERRRLKIENRELLKLLEKEIEEHKLVFEQIRNSKFLLQSIIDGISKPLFLLDNKQSVILMNRAALKYFGTTFQEAIGKPCHNIFKQKCGTCWDCKIHSYVSTGKFSTFERNSPTDEKRIEQVEIYPLKNKGLEGVIVSINDITQIKRAQEQLNRADRLSSLGQLSGGIAHEIRNPLAGMSLFLDILGDTERYEHTDDELEIIGDMKDNVDRIAGIIRRVLDFAKPSATAIKKIDINALIEENIKLWSEKFRKSNIRRILSLAKDLPLVYVDEIELQQIINNLVSNAIEAMGKGGVLSIATAKGISSFFKDRTVARIKIKDTGTGIAPEHLKDIYNPFFSTKAAGTGLGLSIVNQIIKRYGGVISHESNLEEGTVFTIELPIICSTENRINQIHPEKEFDDNIIFQNIIV
ncbi:MAG: response regulator [Actinobacteria bacterium]|nr:response regulator [Actinomycetota bacterium]